MDKIWFVAFDGKEEGPYSFWELKRDLRLTPDTFVWKQGFKDWIAIRFVPELQDIFKDEPESKPLHEEVKPKPFLKLPEEDTLTLQIDPSQFFLWLILILLVLSYVFYQLYRLV